jgi:hypothetical protein
MSFIPAAQEVKAEGFEVSLSNTVRPRLMKQRSGRRKRRYGGKEVSTHSTGSFFRSTLGFFLLTF